MVIKKIWTNKKELCAKALEFGEVGYNAKDVFEADRYKQVLRQYIRKNKLALKIKTGDSDTTFYLIKKSTLPKT